MQIILKDLPKVSLNKWYSGTHWTERKHLKDLYHYAIKASTKMVFSKHDTYNVEYHFKFKSKPLDASNCVAMVKMIEDVLFEDDKHDIVLSIKITSMKGDSDKVIINIL